MKQSTYLAACQSLRFLQAYARALAWFMGMAVVCLLAFSCDDSSRMAKKGLLHLEEGNNVTALSFFERALNRDPDNALALYGKGIITIDESVTANLGYNMLQKARPNLKETRRQLQADLLMAKYLAKNNKQEKALKRLQKAPKEGLSEKKLAIEWIRLLKKWEQNDEARSLIGKAMTLHPEEGTFWYEQGLLEAQERSYANALQSFEQAVKKSSITSVPKATVFLAWAKAAYLADNKEAALKAIDNIDNEDQVLEDKTYQDLQEKINNNEWEPAFTNSE